MTDPLDVVHANSAAFSARDVDGMLALYAEDAEVVDRRRYGLGSFAGHAELRPYYRSIVDSAEEMRETLEVVAAAGELVAAHCRLEGRLRGAPPTSKVTADYGLLVTVRDGLIRRLEVHADGREAAEAGGLLPDPA